MCAYLRNILLYFLIKIMKFFSFFLEIGFSHVFNFGDSCNNCLILVTSFSHKILQTLSLTSDQSIANNPFWFTSFSANVHIFWEIRSLSAPWRKTHWKPTMNHFFILISILGVFLLLPQLLSFSQSFWSLTVAVPLALWLFVFSLYLLRRFMN